MLFGAALLVGGSGAANANIVISINKVAQRMTVTVDGVQRYNWRVSTGRLGYATPSGSFRPFRMERDYFSKEWDDAPMPYSIFFTSQGHAIHGSYDVFRLGRPVSHGCVRLAPQNAATLFALVQAEGMGNTQVIVTGMSIGGLDKLNLPKGLNLPKAKTLFPKLSKHQFGDWLNQGRTQ
jgi:lipoprotein-anchoring transpeptidase ErfK/SrfK